MRLSVNFEPGMWTIRFFSSICLRGFGFAGGIQPFGLLFRGLFGSVFGIISVWSICSVC